MMSIINMMSASEREMNITILQKNSIKTKNIHEKLNKLQVLYEFNERRNNELMLWKKMRRLTKMIEKLTRQRVTVSTVNRCMKNQLKRLKKIISRLEKKFMKKKRRVDNWAKRANEKSMTSFENHLVLSVDVASSIQNHCKKFKIKIFIKEKEKIKRIMMITTENIVRWVREIEVDEMLSTRKNIKTMKKWSNLLIFWVKTKDSKRILKKNDFWIKEVSLNASLCKVNFKIVIHEIKVKEMFKDIKKKRMKTLIKINKDIHLKMMIKKVEWLTKNSEQKRYISLIICIVSVEMMNKLIDERIYHEINIKITQFYDLSCRTHQCSKCQNYDHKTYECKNKIDNEIYLYKMLTTNLLQVMLVRKAEQSHQHWQSSNSALLTSWAHTQSKSEAITTQSSTRWSSHIHRMTAAYMLQLIYDIYTYTAKARLSFCAHTDRRDAVNRSIFRIFRSIYTQRNHTQSSNSALFTRWTHIRHIHIYCEGTTQLLRIYTSAWCSKSIDFSLYQIDVHASQSHTLRRHDTVFAHIHRTTATSLRTRCN